MIPVESRPWNPEDIPGRFPRRLSTPDPQLELLRLIPGAGRFVYPLYDRNRDNLARSGEVVTFTHPRDVDAFLTNMHPTRVSYAMAYTGAEGQEQFAGVIGLDAHLVEPDVGVLNYFTDEALQGRGLAGNAVEGLTSFALSDGGLREVRVSMLLENAASAAVAKKRGFTEVPSPEKGVLLYIRRK